MLTGLYAILIILPSAIPDTRQYNEALNRSREAAMIASGAKDSIDKAVKLAGEFVERKADSMGAKGVLAISSYATKAILAKSVSFSFPVVPLSTIATLRINQDSVSAEFVWGI